MSLNFYLQKIYQQAPLSESEAAAACEVLMQQEMGTPIAGAFLAALAMRGETTEELVGMAQNLRKRTAPLPAHDPAVDILSCGTTNSCAAVVLAASFLLATAGLKVTKYMTGSAAFGQAVRANLREVAAGISLQPSVAIDAAVDALNESGYALLDPADMVEQLRALRGHQESLPLPTVFDRLFPLAHPAHLSGILIGLAPSQTAIAMAQACRRLRVPRAVVLAAEHGVCPFHHKDKITYVELDQGRITQDTVQAADFGIDLGDTAAIDDADVEKQVAWLRAFIDAKETPIHGAILWTSALGMLAAGRVGSIPEGLTLAKQTFAAGHMGGVVALITHGGRKLTA